MLNFFTLFLSEEHLGLFGNIVVLNLIIVSNNPNNFNPVSENLEKFLEKAISFLRDAFSILCTPTKKNRFADFNCFLLWINGKNSNPIFQIFFVKCLF